MDSDANTVWVGVVGSRNRNTPEDKQLIKDTLERQTLKGAKIRLVSGGCRKGADRFAEELAKELGLPILIFYPDVHTFCEKWEYAAACYARNIDIANWCDVLLATWDKVSKGTKHTIDKVEKQDKPVILL